MLCELEKVYHFFQVLNDQQEFAKADELYVKAMQIDPANANLLVHRLCSYFVTDFEFIPVTDCVPIG